jgi:hypothetical protein
MPRLVGVRFKSCGRIYDFDAHELALDKGGRVVVESEFGLSGRARRSCSRWHSLFSYSKHDYRRRERFHLQTQNRILTLSNNGKNPRKHGIIENFTGERRSRNVKVVGNVKVTIQPEDILVQGTNLEEVSQTAAKIEQATRVRRKDPRVFLDGLYVFERLEGMEQ